MADDFKERIVAERAGLYKYALKMAGTVEDADDIVSETMLHALRGQDQINLDTSIHAWLFTVATNVFRDMKKKHRPYSFADFAHEPDVDEFVRCEPDDPLEHETVHRAIERLPPVLKEAVMLRMEGWSYDDLAGRLHLKSGTVRMRVLRAHRLLRTAMDTGGRMP